MAEPTGRLANRGALGAIRLYQLTFSRLFTGSCRFVPSCSAYAMEAIARHGLAHGGWLAARRLLRCHPFCRGGLDQVPVRRGTRPSGAEPST